MASTGTRALSHDIIDYEHVASLVDNESRHDYAFAHLRAGLDSGYSCAYATEETQEIALHKLAQFGIERKFLRDQQLRIFNVNQIYIDDFDPDGVIKMYKEFYATAKVEGFKGFLVVRSVFDFFNSRRHMLEKFLSYELMFEKEKLPCKTTCLYPSRLMELEQILSTMSSHSHISTPSNAMTPQEMLGLVFADAFSKVLGESATRATAFHLRQRGCYSPHLILAGLNTLFGKNGATCLREYFQKSLLGMVRKSHHQIDSSEVAD